MSDKKRLLPCPCCGKSSPVVIVDSNEIDGDMDEGTHVAILCDFRAGGCGTSSGFREKKKEARALWNTRHYAAFGQAAEPCNMVADRKPLDAIGDGRVQDVGP